MIATNLQNIRAAIAKLSSERSFAEPVNLVAVTKTRSIAEMRQAIDAGITIIGENKVQEAQKKHAELNRQVEWHLIGHLQSNKAKAAVQIFDVIESVDSAKIATALNVEATKQGKIQRIYIQVNLVHEAQKSGINPTELLELIAYIQNLPHLQLEGLMFIAPNLEDKSQLAAIFHDMRALYDDVIAKLGSANTLQHLSMGMTNDYPIAIAEGSTSVRLGSAIFGPRNY